MRFVTGTVLIASVVWLLPAPTAAAAAVRYEAENATISQGVVESNWPGFSGTGFVNGTNVAGSYVQLAVTAASAGTATIAIRYANGTTTDRPADVAVNGSTQRISFPDTGDWASWATVTLTAPLNAGTNTIRVTAATAEGNANLDCIDISLVGTEYQAEDATISQGTVDSDHAGFTGTGFLNVDNLAGSYVEFAVTRDQTGPVTLSFRYANGTTTDRRMSIAVNSSSTPVTALSFPGTGAWTTWREAAVTATLNAGSNTVRATSLTSDGGPNLDRLTVGVPDSQAPTVPANPRVTGTTSSSISLAWDASTDNVGVVGYRVYEGTAVVANPTGVTATISGLGASTRRTYTVAARDAAGNESARSVSVTGTTQSGAGGPVEAGPWEAYSPTFTVQERGCGVVDNLTFRLTCSTGDGDQRAERRYATYSGGTRQFQGFFRITSMEGTRISLKQTFKTTGPYFLLAVERGGRLYRVGGDTIASGATVGTTVRVNTVHVVGSTHRCYINGSLRHSYSSASGDFYDKFGAYRTSSGRGPVTVVWSDIQFWRR